MWKNPGVGENGSTGRRRIERNERIARTLY
jgi:hypothetical protein